MCIVSTTSKNRAAVTNKIKFINLPAIIGALLRRFLPFPLVFFCVRRLPKKCACAGKVRDGATFNLRLNFITRTFYSMFGDEELSLLRVHFYLQQLHLCVCVISFFAHPKLYFRHWVGSITNFASAGVATKGVLFIGMSFYSSLPFSVVSLFVTKTGHSFPV